MMSSPSRHLIKKFGALNVSDLHLNHPKVATSKMVDRLIKNITRKMKRDIIQYLICPGDVFDRPTQTDTEAGKQISRFISFLLDFAYKHDLILIVLKGTGSHDGEQSDHFVSMNEGRLHKARLVYIDKITAWEDENGVRFLGVPDEATPSAAQTQAEVESVLKEKGWEQVDIGITHGMYTSHLINGIQDPHSHDVNFYLRIVKYIILNGHIHTPSLYKHLLTIGSHDRTRHGEEEAKGGWIVLIDFTTGEVSTEFFENEDAELFITYEIKADNIKDAYREVDKFLIGHKLVGGGFLRIAHDPELSVNELVRRLHDKYHPEIEFATKKLDGDNAKAELTDRVIEFEQIKTTPITPNTDLGLLEDKLKRMGHEDVGKYLDGYKSVC